MTLLPSCATKSIWPCCVLDARSAWHIGVRSGIWPRGRICSCIWDAETLCFRAIFSEHFLEHLPIETVRSAILPEVRRVLAPGGRIRIGVPNGEYFVDQYIAYRAGERNSLFEEHRGGKTPMTMLNEIAHGFGHYFAYDFETMSSLLSEAGLTHISRRSPFDSDVEHFKGKDRVDEWRNAMTLYVEAEAPRRAA
jgi:predicted SAM-dependent methyltransferase